MPGSLQNILIIFILSIHGLQLTIQRVASIAQRHFKTDGLVREPWGMSRVTTTRTTVGKILGSASTGQPILCKLLLIIF